MNAATVSRLALLLILTLVTAACSDNGSAGVEGPAGPPGAGGPPGPAGPPGGGGGVPVDSAETINIAVTGVTVPAGGGAPVVAFSLSNDLNQGLVGLPAADARFVVAQLSPATAGSGASSQWQSYISRTSGAARQATTETASSDRFVDNNDGTYQYTFASALTAYTGAPAFDSTKTHRLGIEIRNQAPVTGNGIFDFVPAGGTPTFTRLIVDNDTCNACHDVLNFHGGPRTDVQYCVTCHNPSSIDGESGNTVDMKRLIHNIHSARAGYEIIGFGNTVHEWSDIVFPQDIRNCQTCHEESDSDTPQASTYRMVINRAACGTCHYDDGIANAEHEFAIENGVHPGGFTFSDDSQCVDCHGPTGTVTNSAGRLVRVPIAHEIREATAAQAFEYQVVSVTNSAPGQIPSVSIRVLNPTDPNYAANPASTSYDINDPMGPFQTGGASLRLDIGWNNVDLGNLDPNDSLARPAASGTPFAPIVIDFKSGAANDGNNTFSKAAAVAIPTGITGSGMAILEGRPQVSIDGVLTSLQVTAVGLPFAITDPAPVDRRKVVDINKCNDCHNTLSLHGSNRTGNTELCSTCHNPNATDINRRVAGSACVLGAGPDDQALDFKRLIHSIHASGHDGSGREGDPFQVCGFSGAFTFEVGYPGRLRNCEGCHLPNTYYPVDPARVLATTLDANADRSTLTDDVAISPNTSVCSACHTSPLAAEHMKQNGGDFAAGKNDSGALISSGAETCSVCHGPGRIGDVKAVHGVGTFQFN
jgi:OmcA/MtrC family decaheme c-type cytochrome